MSNFNILKHNIRNKALYQSFLRALALIQRGPDAKAKKIMFHRAFDGWPDKIDPVLSRINHEIIPVSTVFLAGSGAIS